MREAAICELERVKPGYTSTLGFPRLRKSMAVYLSRRYQINYDAKQEVLVTVGVSEALDLALRAIVNPGDEIIFHEPSYVSYSPSITLAGRKPGSEATRAENKFSL